MPSRLTAIYPGSFDPPTNGHLNLIARGAHLADHLIVAILQNTQKQPLFSVAERTAMLKEMTASLANVEVDSFVGLLVDYAARRAASVILRGMRGVSDFENESQMASINRRMRPETETIFLTATEETSFVSSRMVREIVTLQGDVAPFVPPAVLRHIRMKFPAGQR